MTKDDIQIFVHIPTIKTERLILRRITKGDLFDVFDYAKNPAVSQFLLWYPHISLADTRAYLATVDAYYKKGKFYDWGIEYEGKMIGTAGFSRFDVENNSAEIGYVLSESYWGKGIALEAARAVLKFGFERLGLRRISAKCIVGNSRSESVMRKCAMTCEGVARDAILAKGRYHDIITYAITAPDYKRGYVDG